MPGVFRLSPKAAAAAAIEARDLGIPMLALFPNVDGAIKDAVASLADYRAQPAIDAPATPERVLWGVEQMRRLKAAQAQAADAAVEPA